MSAHLIPTLESITTERSPSATTRDNKLSVPDCCSWYPSVRNSGNGGNTQKPPFLKSTWNFLPPQWSHVQHANSCFHTDDDIQSNQSQISDAVNITCFFWSSRIESVFTYIICRPKHLTEKNKRILQCPEIHLTLCINIVIHSQEKLLLFDTSQRRFDSISPTLWELRWEIPFGFL